MFSALPQSSYPTVRRSSIQKLFVIWLCPRYDKRRLARVGKDILPSWSSRNCSSTYLLKNIEHRFSMICVNARQWLCEICLVVFLTELKICTFCTRPEFYPLDGTVHRMLFSCVLLRFDAARLAWVHKCSYEFVTVSYLSLFRQIVIFGQYDTSIHYKNHKALAHHIHSRNSFS